MMEIIEKCMRSSDLSGLHALQSMWDNQDPSVFASDRLLESKKSLLMTASKLGHLECCKFLLSIETPNINTRNSDGFTALHYAAYHGQELVVFLLLEAGADPKLRNKLQESILDSAIAGSHSALVDSGAFLGDLKEKLKNLPADTVSIEAADCIGNHNPGPSSDGSAPNSSSSSSSSFNGKASTVCTVPGHDESLSDGEIVEDAPAIRRRKEKEHSNLQGDRKKKSKEESSRSQKGDDLCLQDSDAASKKTVGLSRYEASKYFIIVTTVTDGGEEKLTGLTGNLLGISDPGSEGKVHGKDGSATEKGKGNVKDDFTIGRSRANDFNMDDLSVSKSHAVISYFENVGFFLRDLGSKHGTFSVGKRIGITGPGSSEELPVDDEGNVVISSKKPSSSSSESESKAFKRSNSGMPLADGTIVQFGRVVCRIFKKRQSAVLSSSFQPNSIGVPQSAAVCGLKRKALMALYGHYEKSEKVIETRAVMKPEVPGRSKLEDPSQTIGVRVGAGMGATSQGHLSQLREQQDRDREKEEEQALAMQVGATLLRKMGWEGLAIGRSGAPAAEPLTAVMRADREGLGCDVGPAGRGPTASAGAHYSSSVSCSANNSKKAVMRDKMIARFQNAS